MSVLSQSWRISLLGILATGAIVLGDGETSSNGSFNVQAPAGQFLIGLSICQRSTPDGMVISSIQPLFGDVKGATSLGEKTGWGRQNQSGVRCVAGYAVGSLDIRCDGYLRAVRIKFMRVKGDRLDPDNSYTSAWIGADDKGKESSLSNPTNQWITGISGQQNGDIVALDLLTGTKASTQPKSRDAARKQDRRPLNVNENEVYKGPDISKAPVRYGQLKMDFRTRQIVADELAGFAWTVWSDKLRFRLLGVALLIEPDDRKAIDINSRLMRGLFEPQAGNSSPGWISHFVQVAHDEQTKGTKDDKALAALLNDLAISLDHNQKTAREQLEQLQKEGIAVDWKWADSAHLAQASPTEPSTDIPPKQKVHEKRHHSYGGRS